MGTGSIAWERYDSLRCRAFSRREELSVTGRMALAFGMAALTGLCAQVRFYLPFTTVPVTGQTFAVLLAGTVLGTGYGGLSQVLYVALGAAGLPWFTCASGGFAVLAGETGGYLLGFVLAASLLGRVCDRSAAARPFWPQLGVMALASALILACGWAHLAFVLGRGPWLAAVQGVAPFLPGDALKAVMAAGVSTALLPKVQHYGRGRASR